MLGFKLSDLFRRIENIIREGSIVEADYATALFRVQIGDNTSGWLRCLTLRAGNNKSWHPPEVGESVLVLSPSGDYANGFIIPALFTGNNPPPGDNSDVHHWVYNDGAVIEYNRATHDLNVTLPNNSSSINMNETEILLTVGSSSISIRADHIQLTSQKIDLN